MDIEKIGTVISGGQSGVDRAALKFAVHNGISYSGYCPKGGWAEDYQKPPGILEHYPLLKETESPDPEERTVLNVETSDAVLIFLEGDSPGTELCRKTAEKLGLPLFSCEGMENLEELDSWLDSLPGGAAVNIAGPRESEHPGAEKKTLELLDRIKK